MGSTPRAVFFPAFVSALFFLSCSGAAGKVRILAGNLQFGSGSYGEAVSSYLGALEGGNAPYAEYALGTVYLAMNENDAALARFASAEPAMDSGGFGGLRYRIHYNRGIVFFEQGDFAAAAAEFRAALENDSAKIEAKRNLELSLLSMKQETPETSSPGAGRGGQTEDSALMDYMRRREEDRWRSRQQTEEEPFSGPDW